MFRVRVARGAFLRQVSRGVELMCVCVCVWCVCVCVCVCVCGPGAAVILQPQQLPPHISQHLGNPEFVSEAGVGVCVCVRAHARVSGVGEVSVRVRVRVGAAWYVC